MSKQLPQDAKLKIHYNRESGTLYIKPSNNTDIENLQNIGSLNETGDVEIHKANTDIDDEETKPRFVKTFKTHAEKYNFILALGLDIKYMQTSVHEKELVFTDELIKELDSNSEFHYKDAINNIQINDQDTNETKDLKLILISYLSQTKAEKVKELIPDGKIFSILTIMQEQKLANAINSTTDAEKKRNAIEYMAFKQILDHGNIPDSVQNAINAAKNQNIDDKTALEHVNEQAKAIAGTLLDSGNEQEQNKTPILLDNNSDQAKLILSYNTAEKDYIERKNANNLSEHDMIIQSQAAKELAIEYLATITAKAIMAEGSDDDKKKLTNKLIISIQNNNEATDSAIDLVSVYHDWTLRDPNLIEPKDQAAKSFKEAEKNAITKAKAAQNAMTKAKAAQNEKDSCIIKAKIIGTKMNKALQNCLKKMKTCTAKLKPQKKPWKKVDTIKSDIFNL